MLRLRELVVLRLAVVFIDLDRPLLLISNRLEAQATPRFYELLGCVRLMIYVVKMADPDLWVNLRSTFDFYPRLGASPRSSCNIFTER